MSWKYDEKQVSEETLPSQGGTLHILLNIALAKAYKYGITECYL